MKERISQSEDPSLFPNSYTYDTIYQKARENGIRVVLSGEWGDGVVSYGRGSLLEFVFSGKFLRLIREIIGLSKNFRTKKRTIIWNDLVLPIIPGMIRKQYYRAPMKWIRDDFARRTGLVDYYENLRKAELIHRTSRKCHFFDLSTYPVSLTLEEINKNAAAHSVEVRYPFLDRRVIEFCLALPPEQRIREGYTRAIERESLADYLPPEIRQRTSKAISDPYIRHGLVKFEEENLKNLLCGHPDAILSYIDLDFMYGVYRKLMSGSAVNLIPLWRTIILSAWLHEENLKISNERTKKKSS
jgi:asparagine synthase (glutamine-hydrolysing)